MGWPEIRRSASRLPLMSQTKWARVESSVNLDASGNPDLYFMSLDLATARHSQTLLATHFKVSPLPWIMERRSVCWCP